MNGLVVEKENTTEKKNTEVLWVNLPIYIHFLRAGILHIRYKAIHYMAMHSVASPSQPIRGGTSAPPEIVEM